MAATGANGAYNRGTPQLVYCRATGAAVALVAGRINLKSVFLRRASRLWRGRWPPPSDSVC